MPHLSQIKHLKFITSECLKTWSFKLFWWLKHCWQMGHSKGFAPVCVRICWFSCPFKTNRFKQTSHWRGFTAKWVFMWAFKSLPRKKRLEQSGHSCVFSPVWIITCWFNLLILEKDFMHFTQLNAVRMGGWVVFFLSFRTFFTCFFRSSYSVKVSLQAPHW